MTRPPELDEASRARIHAEERERQSVRDELARERRQRLMPPRSTLWLLVLVVALFLAYWAIWGPPWETLFQRSPYGL